jgi:hypothetical protein
VVRLQELTYLLFGVVEVLIGTRFVLRAFGASPEEPLAGAIYALTSPLLAPSSLWLGQPQLARSAFEPHCAVGIVAYALLGWVLAKLVGLAVDADAPAAGDEQTSGLGTAQGGPDQEMAA